MIQFISRVYSVTSMYTQKHSMETIRYEINNWTVKPRSVEERDRRNAQMLKERAMKSLRFSRILFGTDRY